MKTSLFNNYKVNLVESLEDIEIMKSQFSKDIMVGCDTETTGLSYLTDKIVGYCFSTGKSYSVNDYQGYYLPVRHLNYNNLPLDKVVEVTQWVLDNFKVCFFNRPFDFSMMELDGIHCPFVGHTHDAQIMAFLVTGESFPALKPSVKKYLKLDIIEFSDNNATDHNFGTTDPTVTYVYAANDPLITVLLARKLWSEYPYIRKIYPIDNKAGEAVRKFAKETLVYLNYDILDKESESVNFQIQELKNKIFSFVGYQFKLNSTRDKGDALNRYVTLTQKTKKGQFAVDKEVLAKIDHPLAKMLLEYTKLERYRGSYIDKMKEFPRDGFHVNYSTVNVSCLTKSNKVQTLRGLISVTDVVENDLILTRFGYKRVLWKKSFYDDTLKILFKNGSFIEGNAKHPVLVGDKWVGLGDLKLGNHVKILSDTHFHPSEVKLPEFVQDSYARKLINFSLTVDAELASCFGFIDGDGSLVPDGVKLWFSEFEPEVEQYYIKLFSDRFNMELPSRSIGNEHTVQYKFCSSSLSRYLKLLRLKPHGLEQGIDISQWSSECQLAYVAALFDTDGSVNRSGKNYNLRLSMTSKGCIDNVVSVLRFHGIDVHEFIVSSNRKQPLYSLRVRGRQSVLRFISLVAPFMRCNHKFERLLEYQCLIADIKSPWDKYQDSTTVVNIEQTGYQEVIDIEVEDCHEFIANGIVTHNTGRMSSGSSKGNPYFENLNIQNIPKVEVYRYLHRGSVLGYFADDNPFEPIAQETLDQCEPFEIISQEQVGTKKLYKITKDDGTVLSLCEGTYVKISRDGKRLYEAVENLKSGDELL